MRKPRRKCTLCRVRNLCSTCRPYCPCRKLPTDWIKKGIEVTAYGRYGGPWRVKKLVGDTATIENYHQPPTVRETKLTDLLPTS